MKDKFILRLKAKFPGVNLAKTRVDKFAALAEKRLTAEATEEDIDSFIDDLNEVNPFADIAKNDDAVRTAATKKAKDEADAKAKAEQEAAAAGSDPTKKDDEVPAWAKGFMSKIESLEKTLAGEKTKSTLTELAAAAKAKGIPEKLALKYQIGEGYDQEAALTELEADWKEMSQGMVIDSLKKNSFVPAGGGTKVKDADKPSEAKVKSVLDKIM